MATPLPRLLVYITLALTALVLIILYRSHKAMFSVLVDPRGQFRDMPFNTATTATATTTTYHSDYPSLSIQLGSLPTARGGGILTVQSGCRMSRWIFHGRECKWSSPQPQISQYLQNGSQLKENDTIYVPFTEVEQFVNDILDDVSTTIVVISGDWQNVGPISNTTIGKLLNHSRVLKWFCQNLPKYGGVNPYHPKIAPFPYGLKEGGRPKLNPLPSYKHIFFGSLQNKSLLNKSNFIFAGPLGNGDGKHSSLPQLTTPN